MTTISGGQTLVISAGQRISGLVVQSSGTVDVLSGGATMDTTLSGGSEEVYLGGSATSTTVDSGGQQYVYSGGIASATIVSSGGTETVMSGGIASAAIVWSGGTETVMSGGTASGTVLGGGNVTSTSEAVTPLHYAPNANEAFGSYNAPGDPGSDGFNLADVSSVADADALPAGVMGLVWLGATSGLTAAFEATVNAAANDPKVYGFYVADEPPDSAIPNLAIEDAYIKQHAPGKVSFIVAENNGTSENPSYAVTPGNTGADLIGLDPYPVQPQFAGGIDLGIIDAAVQEATNVGWSLSQIVPVYQAFGGGGYASWTLPTASQEQQILAEWGNLTPNPAFDYAYSWGTQDNDSALANTPALQAVFAQHNALTAGTGGAAGTGGVEQVAGTAIGTQINGGGEEIVSSGGVASSATVTSGGLQQVLSGGRTVGTVLSAGTETILAGGTASRTVVNSGGNEQVFGVAIGSQVTSGGTAIVHSGAVASATTISGGLVEVMIGGSTGGSRVTFAGGGELQLDASTTFTGAIAGFAVPDQLDLRDIAFGSGTTERFAEARSKTWGTLTVSDGTHTAKLRLIGTYVTSQFNLSSDGYGGTLVTDPPLASGSPSAHTIGSQLGATTFADLALPSGQDGSNQPSHSPAGGVGNDWLLPAHTGADTSLMLQFGHYGALSPASWAQ